MRTLIIDLDGVSVQFVPGVCNEHNALTGDNLKPEDITDWNMKLFGIQNEVWQKPGFFAALKPMPGAIAALNRLRKKYRLTIATDTMGIGFVREDKADWIERHIPWVSDVYYLSDKSEVPGDLLFDDAPHHLAAWPKIAVKMVTPYNLKAPADHEVKSWREFEALLKSGIV
jgi:5'-nucleotidase